MVTVSGIVIDSSAHVNLTIDTLKSVRNTVLPLSFLGSDASRNHEGGFSEI